MSFLGWNGKQTFKKPLPTALNPLQIDRKIFMAGPIGQTLFPEKPEVPEEPLPEVTRMPTKADGKKAKRLAVLSQAERRGRASTILTETAGSDTLGA